MPWPDKPPRWRTSPSPAPDDRANQKTYVREANIIQKKKNLMSVIFWPVILGPEMAAPISWAPGIFWFFLLETPMPIKFLVLGGGGCSGFFFEGGWKCQFYVYGRGDFSE